MCVGWVAHGWLRGPGLPLSKEYLIWGAWEDFFFSINNFDYFQTVLMRLVLRGRCWRRAAVLRLRLCQRNLHFALYDIWPVKKYKTGNLTCSFDYMIHGSDAGRSSAQTFLTLNGFDENYVNRKMKSRSQEREERGVMENTLHLRQTCPTVHLTFSSGRVFLPATVNL